MAFLVLKKQNLRHNFEFLKRFFDLHGVYWGVVSKLMCGNTLFLNELISLGVLEIHDSRISNLKKIKEINPQIQTVYIKPVSKSNVFSMVKHADVSLNSELETIRWISDAAYTQQKCHKIIIMVETGDLREGVMGEKLINFYEKVFELPNIQIIGLGTNLNCLNGVMPSADKLIQLCLYKQIIELKFQKEIPWVSAGSSVTIPLLMNKQLPWGVNHFRVGEALYFGLDLFENKLIEGMNDDVFQLHTEIIEIQEKPLIPVGNMRPNPQGIMNEFDKGLYGKSSFRAILDIGLLDVDPKYLIPSDDSFDVIGASSDMLVINLFDNPNMYKVGDQICFQLKYMGALSLMNSRYIEKKVVKN